MKKITILFVLLFVVNLNLYSKEIKIGIGLSLPPYVISENSTGIEMDIVREALKNKGYLMKPVYVPFARVLKVMQMKTVDAVLTVNEASGLENVYYSNYHITYQNVAVTLKSRNIRIDKIEDLKKGRVVGFQNANLYLGPHFKKTIEKNSNYREIARQDLQVKLIYRKRADVLVMDINIFKFFKQKVTGIDTTQEVVFHQIFEKSNFKVGFRNKKIRDDFNIGLKQLKSNKKRIDSIYRKYIK